MPITPVPTSDYRTAPLATKRLPPGLAFIVGNGAAERFSFYGMRAILVVFMTNYLLNDDGSSKLAGADYFLFFTALMLVTAIAFAFVVRFYSGRPHLHQAGNTGSHVP